MCGEDPGILLQFSHVVQHGVYLLFSTNIYHTLPKIATEIFRFFFVYGRRCTFSSFYDILL